MDDGAVVVLLGQALEVVDGDVAVLVDGPVDELQQGGPRLRPPLGQGELLGDTWTMRSSSKSES